jgi:hypothetical protein
VRLERHRLLGADFGMRAAYYRALPDADASLGETPSQAENDEARVTKEARIEDAFPSGLSHSVILSSFVLRH